jgi:alpha-L-rhamnosidase
LRCDRVPSPAGACSAPLPDMVAGEKLLATFLAEGDARQFSSKGIHAVSDIEAAAPGAPGRMRVPCDLSGPHVLLYFIASRTGMMVKRPAVGAEGYVLDHYDRAAIEHHLKFAGDRLIKALGPNRPYAVFSDSLEVYQSDWTGDLLQEFQKRRGYDLTPLLPALVGELGPDDAAIRHDWGKTLTELAGERYLTPLREWAQKNGTRFRSQTYGTPPVSLSSNALVDLPEGEGPQWRAFSATRWAASASHVYGKPVTSSETWTWLHSPAFRATPLDMKAEADLHFLQGVNQLIGHGWPYSPEIAGRPGWSLYAAAVVNDHNPWWLIMPDLTRYLQRVSFMLRQGKPANDVALYLPTSDAWAQFTNGKTTLNGTLAAILGANLIPQILDAGYNFDFIDDQAIASLGVQYPVLILPAVERIPLATYRKIQDYAAKGGIVVPVRRLPSLAPGRMEAAADTPRIQELSRALFGGRLIPGEDSLGRQLNTLFAPDFTTSPPAPELGFIHRKLDGADVYFVANTSNHAVHSKAVFRIRDIAPEIWDPFSGKTSAANANGAAEVALELEPYESRLVVFSKDRAAAPQRPEPGPRPAPVDISSDWNVSFPELKRTLAMPQLRSWDADEDTRYFSGQATYSKTVTLPESFLKPEFEFVLDFGPGTPVPTEARRPANGMRAMLESPVREAAMVYVNDQLAGPVWRPPYRVDVTRLLRQGENKIRVVVGNLAINELAGKAPISYRLLNLRYTERFTMQDMNNLKPQPAGILGPIRLLAR